MPTHPRSRVTIRRKGAKRRMSHRARDDRPVPGFAEPTKEPLAIREAAAGILRELAVRCLAVGCDKARYALLQHADQVARGVKPINSTLRLKAELAIVEDVEARL